MEKVAELLRGSDSSSGSGKKGKRKLSRKARKAIADAQKARWAKVRAAKKKAQ